MVSGRSGTKNLSIENRHGKKQSVTQDLTDWADGIGPMALGRGASKSDMDGDADLPAQRAGQRQTSRFDSD